MQKNPYHVSPVRSVYGIKTPVIGVFLLISLIINQPTLVMGRVVDGRDTTAVSADIAKQELKSEEPQAPPVVIEETDPVAPPVTAEEAIDPIISSPPGNFIGPAVTIEEEKSKGQILIEEEGAETERSITEVEASGKALLKPSLTGNDFRAPTLGKYITPNVSAFDGSLNYEYSLSLPPGRAGFTPAVSLSYNNNNKSHSSVIGIGWSLNIPYIQRVNKKGADKIYSENNFFSSWDGELVDQGGGIFVPRTENGSFLKYVYQNNSWTVTDKLGTRYRFGMTAQARQYNHSNSDQIFSWMLESATDTNGNTISYKYSEDYGQIYPDSISYADQKFKIEFIRSSLSIGHKSYQPGFLVFTRDRISEIRVKIDDTVVTKYLIEADDNLVKNITVEGYKEKQSFKLPPVKFAYGIDNGSKKWDLDQSFDLPTLNGKVVTIDFKESGKTYGNSFIDVNGDGLSDIIRWKAGEPNGYANLTYGNQVFINTGFGFELDSNFLLPTLDNGQVVNLDIGCVPNAGNCGYGNSFIDINGDGLIDVVRWKAGQPNGYANLTYGNQVFINTGSSFVLDKNFLLPTDKNGLVLTLDYNNSNKFGNSFKDINGDGRPDIVRWSAGHRNGYFNANLNEANQVFINTGFGFKLDPNFLLPTDSLGYVLVLDYKESYYYGNSFIDINGDGLLDVVRWDSSRKNGAVSPSPQNISGNQVFINNGFSFELDSSFLLPAHPNGTVLVLDYKFGNVWGNNYGNYFLDINGDGLVDVVRWKAGQPNGYGEISYGNQVFLNNGHGFNLDPEFYLPTFNNKVVTLDYNYTSYNSIYGNSFLDVNGDGLLDVVRWSAGKPHGYCNPNYSNGNQVFINTGSNFRHEPSFILPMNSSNLVMALDASSSYNFGNSFIDINGDGILDIVRWAQGYRNGFAYTTSFGNQVFLGRIGRKEVRKITNSSGGQYSFLFKGIRQFTDANNIGLNASIPEDNKSFVVSSKISDDGNGNIETTKYWYQGAAYHNQLFDKKFAGFSEVIQTNPDKSVIVTLYHQGNNETGNEPSDSYAKIGKIYEERVQDLQGNLSSRVRKNYSEDNLGGNAKSIQLDSQLTQIFSDQDTHQDTAEEYTYDQYGNLIQKKSFGEVLGSNDGSFQDIGNDKFVENISYAKNSDNYLVGLPSRFTLFKGDGTKVRESKFYYDNLASGAVILGNQTKIENWKSGTSYTNTQSKHNSLGLPVTFTDERGKTTSYVYDTDNLYPISVKNSLGFITQFSYDYLTGSINKIIDQNDFTYRTDFDVFGRPIKEFVPNPSSNSTTTLILKTEYVYTDTPLAVSVKKKNYTDKTESIDIYQYFDGFNRLIQERQEAEGVSKFIVRDLTYNSLGKYKKESLKYFDSGFLKTSPTSNNNLYINYTYDLLGRPISTINSIGTTSIFYDGFKTTVTNEAGKIKNYYKDAYGNLVKVEEYNKGHIYTTSYEWDGNKKLTKITDALGNFRTFTYDGLGRRLSADDLHAPGDTTFGVWTYTYDDAGNIVSTKNPKGELVNYIYDDLSRLYQEYTLSSSSPEFLYVYDNFLASCTNSRGRLCAVFTSNGDNTYYQYNSHGAIANERKFIDGFEYITAYFYDLQGKITDLKYPDNSEVRYTYNNAGLLETVQRKENNSSFSYVISNFDYSPLGQVITSSGANGTLTTTKTYDADKLYRLVNIKTINSAPLKLQDLTYIYDSVGNIISVSDTSNTNTAKTVIYTYDDLNRLISATTNNVAFGKSYTQLYTYDAIGNIIAKSDETYEYGGVGYTNPHAVTRISSPDYIQSFSYDANGNMVSKSTTTITAFLNASVNPNGKSTTAGFSGPGVAGGAQSIGSGNSPVPLTPYTLTGLLPNSTYNYQVFANNSEGSLNGSNLITLSTSSGPDPDIFSTWVSNITDRSVTFGGQINPSGRSTNVWYELAGGPGGGQYGYKHLEDCNTPVELPSVVVGNLATSTSYQMRIVAENDKGTTASSWFPFQTKSKSTSEPLNPPLLASANVTANIFLNQVDNANYSWNYKNQLIGVSNSTSGNTYLYDYSGNRIKASVYQKNTNKTYTTYYPNRFYEVSKSAGAVDQEKKYIYAGNTLVATIKKVGASVTPTYVYNDNLGGASVITDSAGNIIQAIDYYPYGQERVCGGPGNSACDAEKKYIGEYYDVDTALNYLNARYYSSFIGRFISQDPMFWSPEKLLTDPQSLNSYSYARNNPIIYRDKTGKYIETAFDIAMFAISLNDFKQEPGFWNGIAVLGDGASIVIPVVPAVFGGIIRGSKLIKGIDKASDAAHISKGVDETIDVVKISDKYNWGRPDSLVDHFNRHGRDFDAKNAEDYAKKASNFFTDSQKKGFPTKIDSQGIKRIYDPKTNTFGSFNPDGSTKTFFKPDSPTEYWDAQPGTLIQKKGGKIWK